MVAMRRIALAVTIMLFFVGVCEGSVVYVYPVHPLKQEGTTFDVVISCNPSEPIKAYEFMIEFNKLLLQANSVTKGNFFSGYQEFFNSGIIQNDQGKIINIYNLIVGHGNVTHSGTFVIISFTAKNETGLSPIHIYNCGITNETKYLAVGVFDGSVQIYGDYYPWDINKDNAVNYVDLSSIVFHYHQSCNPPGSQPWDVMINGMDDYIDLSAMVSHYGERYS